MVAACLARLWQVGSLNGGRRVRRVLPVYGPETTPGPGARGVRWMHGRMVSAHDWVMRSPPPLLPVCQFERYEAELLAFHSSLGDVKTYVALRTPMIKDEDNSGTMRRLWGGGTVACQGGGGVTPFPNAP